MSMKDIQTVLKAPKGQHNKAQNYRFRSCEDIVEAVKPILSELGCHLNLSDDIVMVGDRIYVKSTASILKGSEILGLATAFAREPLLQKGMSESQATGAASSYARKYALNGLLAIDDTKDADTNEYREAINSAASIEGLSALYKSMSPEVQAAYIGDFKAAKEKLQ